MEQAIIAQGPVDLTVGPWCPLKSSMPQAGGLDWCAVRELRTGPGFGHFEQMRNLDGDLMRFATEIETLGAISKANGTPWFTNSEEAESALAGLLGGGSLSDDINPRLAPIEWTERPNAK